MASPITVPAKMRAITVNGNMSTIGGLVQTALQALDANTVIFSTEYIRSENSQGVACIITMEIP